MTSPQPAIAHRTAGRALTGVGQVREATEAAKQIRQWWLAKTNYTLHLTADDELYPDAHAWILELLPEANRRMLHASTRTVVTADHDAPVPVDLDSPIPSTRLTVRSQDSRPQKVHVDGHPISVYVMTEDSQAASTSLRFKPDTLVFTSRTRAGQQAVQQHLERLLRARALGKRQPVIRLMNTSWGSWTRRGDLPPRPIASVVLAAGQMERLSADLGTFLADEAMYNAKAIPWHRGYLLQGPPGSGKTSIAKALASHFGLDLWYAPLGDVKDDSNLLNLLSQVDPRSMLLLEDVDVFAATQERDAEKTSKLSLSGLLNALDGVATPHGLITVMTTNHPDVLDPALLRAGRMDLIETVALPGVEQIGRMFTAFYGQTLTRPLAPPMRGLSSADVTEVFKQHMRDPQGGESHLRQRLGRSSVVA